MTRSIQSTIDHSFCTQLRLCSSSLKGIQCLLTAHHRKLHNHICSVLAGSKVAVTSIIHMIWEMAAILIAYKLLGIWTVRSPAEIYKLV